MPCRHEMGVGLYTKGNGVFFWDVSTDCVKTQCVREIQYTADCWVVFFPIAGSFISSLVGWCKWLSLFISVLGAGMHERNIHFAHVRFPQQVYTNPWPDEQDELPAEQGYDLITIMETEFKRDCIAVHNMLFSKPDLMRYKSIMGTKPAVGGGIEDLLMRRGRHRSHHSKEERRQQASARLKRKRGKSGALVIKSPRSRKDKKEKSFWPWGRKEPDDGEVDWSGIDSRPGGGSLTLATGAFDHDQQPIRKKPGVIARVMGGGTSSPRRRGPPTGLEDDFTDDDMTDPRSSPIHSVSSPRISSQDPYFLGSSDVDFTEQEPRKNAFTRTINAIKSRSVLESAARDRSSSEQPLKKTSSFMSSEPTSSGSLNPPDLQKDHDEDDIPLTSPRGDRRDSVGDLDFAARRALDLARRRAMFEQPLPPKDRRAGKTLNTQRSQSWVHERTEGEGPRRDVFGPTPGRPRSGRGSQEATDDEVELTMVDLQEVRRAVSAERITSSAEVRRSASSPVVGSRGGLLKLKHHDASSEDQDSSAAQSPTASRVSLVIPSIDGASTDRGTDPAASAALRSSSLGGDVGVSGSIKEEELPRSSMRRGSLDSMEERGGSRRLKPTVSFLRSGHSKPSHSNSPVPSKEEVEDKEHLSIQIPSGSESGSRGPDSPLNGEGQLLDRAQSVPLLRTITYEEREEVAKSMSLDERSARFPKGNRRQFRTKTLRAYEFSQNQPGFAAAPDGEDDAGPLGRRLSVYSLQKDKTGRRLPRPRPNARGRRLSGGRLSPLGSDEEFFARTQNAEITPTVVAPYYGTAGPGAPSATSSISLAGGMPSPVVSAANLARRLYERQASAMMEEERLTMALKSEGTMALRPLVYALDREEERTNVLDVCLLPLPEICRTRILAQSVEFTKSILFMKRLLVLFSYVGIESFDAQGRSRSWQFPLASTLCHGNRVLVKLENVFAPQLMYFLLTGEQLPPDRTADLQEIAKNTILQQRLAATHGVELSSRKRDLTELRLRATNLASSAQNIADGLTGHHYGLDIPWCGAGAPMPVILPRTVRDPAQRLLQAENRKNGSSTAEYNTSPRSPTSKRPLLSSGGEDLSAPDSPKFSTTSERGEGGGEQGRSAAEPAQTQLPARGAANFAAIDALNLLTNFAGRDLVDVKQQLRARLLALKDLRDEVLQDLIMMQRIGGARDTDLISLQTGGSRPLVSETPTVVDISGSEEMLSDGRPLVSPDAATSSDQAGQLAPRIRKYAIWDGNYVS